MNVDIQDHSAEVSDAIKAALLRGLEKCGLVAEGYAKKLVFHSTNTYYELMKPTIEQKQKEAYKNND